MITATSRIQTSIVEQEQLNNKSIENFHGKKRAEWFFPCKISIRNYDAVSLFVDAFMFWKEDPLLFANEDSNFTEPRETPPITEHISEESCDLQAHLISAEELQDFIYNRYIRGEEGSEQYALFSKLHKLWHNVTYYAGRSINGPDNNTQYKEKVTSFTQAFVLFIRTTRDRMVADSIITKHQRIRRFTTYITKITANSRDDVTYSIIDTESNELPQVQLTGDTDDSFKKLMGCLIDRVFVE